MFNQISLGFKSYFRAHRFIWKQRLWPYLLVPGVINILLIALLVSIAVNLDSSLQVYIDAILSGNEAWWFKLSEYLIRLLLNLIIILVYFIVYKNLVLIIMAPVLALLSEKVDSLYTGRDFPFKWKVFISDVWRGVLIAVRNLFLELSLIAVFVLFGLIPLIGIISPIIIILIECYFYGYSMIDYSNERKQMTMRASNQYVKENKYLSTTIGLMFYLMFLIPFIGWIFAPCYGIVAGTLAVLERDGVSAPYFEPR
mgnify:CR=1 FL=1